MRVLIAEDDGDVRALIEVALLDHHLIMTNDGDEALDALQTEAVDAAVLDVMMPGTDGFNVCRAIRQNDRLKDIPVVMLTARVREDDHIKGFEAGADRYMTKPFEPDQLTDVLEELAGTPTERRQRERRDQLDQARFLRHLEQRF